MKQKLITSGILLAVALSFLAALVATQLPHSYKASGLLIVTRQADTASPNYFSYEGYYAQQTAQQYTDSVLGIIKSLSLQQLALVQTGMPNDAASVKKFSNSILVQKMGPQLIGVTVSSSSPNTSRTLWKALSGQITDAVAKLNKEGDSQLALQVLSSEPLVEDVSAKPVLYGVAAFLALIAAEILAWAGWQYLRGNK